MTRVAGTIMALVVMLAIAGTAGAAALAQAAPLRVAFVITDNGYKCTTGCDSIDFSGGAWYPVLDVPLGSLVEVHFTWGHEAYPLEEHLILLEGYGVETATLNSQQREGTLRFIADQPGSFTFKCDLHCDLHDYMQRAQVRVQRAGAGGAATGASAYTPTKLELQTPASVASGFDPVQLRAVLTDQEGGPVKRAWVRFYLDTQFGGVQDLVQVGAVRTDDQGAASYPFRLLTGDPEQRLVARFAGMGTYDESEAEVRLRVTGQPPAAYHPEQTRFELAAGQFGRVGVVVVIATIWSIFGFVLFQVVRIARDRS